MLVSGIMDNLTNTFSSVNDQVGQIAADVGRTPSSFLPAVFNMDSFKVAQQLLNGPLVKAIEYSAMGGGIYED